ncbi:MAG: TraB/GumN family protein [Proteobacteria bacterium]|nr:TraB/GumN family protein [Pseudomonadota bacterium]
MRFKSIGLTAFSLALALVPGLMYAPDTALGQDAPEPTRRPFLWRIEGEPPSYLYGTIHVPDERVLALPPAVTLALDEAQVFCPEVWMDPEGQMKMTLAVLLPRGQSLGDLLPEALYRRLDRYMQREGVPLAFFERMKLWAVAANLGLLDYYRQGAAMKPPHDLHLYGLADAAGKRLDALETIEEQMALMDSVDRPHQIAMLEEALGHLERVEPGAASPIEELIAAYLSGDGDRLMRVGLQYTDLDDPRNARFTDALIRQRNHTMAAAIDERLRAASGPSYFFALGSLHLPGAEGLVSLLRERGHALERVGSP